MRVLIPLPDRDFDVTEVSVPWRLLTRAGHQVTFATERGGTAAQGDPLLLSGVIFGQLGADPEPRAFYGEMIASPEFKKPIAWSEIDAPSFNGVILPGGHAQGMRQYLEGHTLFERVSAFWKLGRPVGAICHGTIVLARSTLHGRSLLAERRTTCLPKFMEGAAYLATFWKLGRYYRTYPAYVEDEVKAALIDPEKQFERGPLSLTRGTPSDDTHAFVVEDGHYLSARWPGDAYLFARRFIAKLSAN